MSDKAIEAAAIAIYYKWMSVEDYTRPWDECSYTQKELGLDLACAALAAYEAALWQTMESAPRDGTLFIAHSQDLTCGGDLPSFVSLCAWHPDAGFCTDELREPTHWRPLPASPNPAHHPARAGSE